VIRDRSRGRSFALVIGRNSATPVDVAAVHVAEITYPDVWPTADGGTRRPA
jgi:hypothetical protein